MAVENLLLSIGAGNRKRSGVRRSTPAPVVAVAPSDAGGGALALGRTSSASLLVARNLPLSHTLPLPLCLFHPSDFHVFSFRIRIYFELRISFGFRHSSFGFRGWMLDVGPWNFRVRVFRDPRLTSRPLRVSVSLWFTSFLSVRPASTLPRFNASRFNASIGAGPGDRRFDSSRRFRWQCHNSRTTLSHAHFLKEHIF